MHWQSQPTVLQSTDEKSFSSISSIYGKNSGIEIKTCASLKEMVSVRMPSKSDQWWCILVSCNFQTNISNLRNEFRHFAIFFNFDFIYYVVKEFSCQEVRDSSDDMVIFFATNSDMRRFLSILESIWQTKNVSKNRASLFCNLNIKLNVFFYVSRLAHFQCQHYRKIIYQLMVAVCSSSCKNHGSHCCQLLSVFHNKEQNTKPHGTYDSLQLETTELIFVCVGSSESK